MHALIFLTATFAFTLSAIAGGGASLLVVPLLSQVVPIRSVPAALSIGTAMSSVSRIIAFRKHIRWDIALYFVPAAIPMALVGAALLRFINPAYVQLVMALFLVSNLPQMFKKQAEPELRPVSRTALLAIGATAGLLSGLTGAVGVLFNRFYLNYGLSKEEIVATRATNEVLVHVAKLVAYGYIGLLNRDVAQVGALVGAAAVLSAWLLPKLLRRVSRKVFANIGYAAMFASGLFLLSTSASAVQQAEKLGAAFDLFVSGAEAKLLWRESSISVEFSLDGELELELALPMEALNDAQRALVERMDPGSDTRLSEVVYGPGETEYEVYFFRDGSEVKQIVFDEAGQLLKVDEHK